MNISSSSLQSLYKQYALNVSDTSSTDQNASERTTSSKTKKSGNDSFQLSPEAMQMFMQLQQTSGGTDETSSTDAVEGVTASSDSTSTDTSLSDEDLDRILKQLSEALSSGDSTESTTAVTAGALKHPMGPPPPGGRPPGGPGGPGGPGKAEGTDQSSAEKTLDEVLKLLNDADDDDSDDTDVSSSTDVSNVTDTTADTSADTVTNKNKSGLAEKLRDLLERAYNANSI